MIAFIDGQVILIEQNYLVLKVSNIGYQVYMSKKDLETFQIDQSVALYAHTHVREDILELYGFTTLAHRQIFLLLISVAGVGPKLALAILSTLVPRDLLDAIINKNLALLSSVSGVGKKTAERLSLELKDKAVKIDCGSTEVSPKQGSIRTSLEQAIRSLGYSKSQSDRAILSLDQNELANLPLEMLIKKTLNVLTGNKS